jgi:hypothetical protein
MLTMRPSRVTIHRPRPAGAVLIACLTLIGACGPAPSPTPVAVASPTQSSSPTSAPTIAATPSSIPTPRATQKPTAAGPSATTSPIVPSAFTTPAPLTAGATWKGIDWHKLKSGDPLATIGSMTHWRDGYVAVGAIVGTGDTSRSPVWASTDGIQWKPLTPEALGPATIVLGVGATPTGVVALTLQGGRNRCSPGAKAPACWTLAAPLQVWTSTDGVDWTPHAGPVSIPIAAVGCDDCGLEAPSLRVGAAGLLAFKSTWSAEQGGSPVALSKDGITWKRVLASALPAGFELSDIEPSGSGFIAVGAVRGVNSSRAMALTSTDGRHWVAHFLPTPADAGHLGTSAGGAIVGSKGVVVVGGTGGVPGHTIWWTSVTGGRTWSRFLGYPPIGIDKTATDAGSDAPFGELVGDGTHIYAERGGDRSAAWSSLDGRTWGVLTVGRTHHPQINGALTLLSIGLLWSDDDGPAWLGKPAVQ